MLPAALAPFSPPNGAQDISADLVLDAQASTIHVVTPGNLSAAIALALDPQVVNLQHEFQKS